MQFSSCYSAMLARDYRFDGKFFVCVKTTGIYCRPICPAMPPKRENVEFFPSALLAEGAGYRPCLRCRPESAPLSPAWQGKTAIVNRALKHISQHGLIAGGEENFAGKFGVTARHLRRLFQDEIGQTPKQISDNNRLSFSRKLVLETNLPLTKVAMTSGFSSVRRFNDAFQKKFQRTPSVLRKRTSKKNKGSEIFLTLSYRPPFDWKTILGFYRSHVVFGVERVGEDFYERVFSLNGSIGKLRVSLHNQPQKLLLQVSTENPAVLFPVAQKTRKMFDLDSDPLLIANCFRSDPLLHSLWRKFPGCRIPMGWNSFESSICTILGQLVSTSQAMVLVEQLVKAYGKSLSSIGYPGRFLFPEPSDLVNSSLTEVKTTKARKHTIREFSRLVLDRRLDLSPQLNPEVLREQLLQVSGIGPWTSECIGLFALGEPDFFPGTDLILKRALALHPKLDLDVVRPWRSYAAIYLWREYAQKLSKK